MPDIASIDRNFAVSAPDANGMVWRNALSWPFRIFGLLTQNGVFVRMLPEVASLVNPGTADLTYHTAGGRLRFRTDASSVSIRARLHRISRMPHFALTGIAGFDLYDGQTYVGTFVPPFDVQEEYTSVLALTGGSIHEVTIHFPTYAGVLSLEIGLPEHASLEACTPYRPVAPIVTYGSSITQGGCVSRPGNCYQNILSRRLNVDHVNLGFSGNAKGERTMAEYIAGLPMSVFVMDYDHNAPDVPHLQRTHEPFFQLIRQARPELPVIMMPRPKACPNDLEKQRRDIVRATYDHAVRDGDRHVYYIDMGSELRDFCGNDGTVDNCHPNDLGFRGMAAALEKIMGTILLKA